MRPLYAGLATGIIDTTLGVLNGTGGLLEMMGSNMGCGCGGIWKRRDSASADHGHPKRNTDSYYKGCAVIRR
ncbi:MAG TPA: hypothetical protein H9968_11280 [Candidatus Anaerobutyricum stercoris]|uniref:Uncharacterized protein n=1 Tax=Candidatus Anaerobutyricum stercoris TaxID=2838457 RepID=A0A9D2J8H0_9FIRM|nr:hypothetical protein [Candidatus Anaerobutyricum stercoris]